MFLLLMGSQSIKWNNKKMLYESEQKGVFPRRNDGWKEQEFCSQTVRATGTQPPHTIKIPAISGRLFNISVVQLFRSKMGTKMHVSETPELAITKHNRFSLSVNPFTLCLGPFLCFLWCCRMSLLPEKNTSFAYFILSVWSTPTLYLFLNNSLWGGGKTKHLNIFWG